MAEAISEYEPRLNRSQFIRKGNFDVLLDAYNSNPSSLRLALQSLQRAKHKRKMVILGAMLELGAYEESEHKKAIEKLLEIHPEKIWLVGEQFRPYASQENTRWFENGKECKKAFENLDFKDGIVLIKGSRKFELEKLIS